MSQNFAKIRKILLIVTISVFLLALFCLGMIVVKADEKEVSVDLTADFTQTGQLPDGAFHPTCLGIVLPGESMATCWGAMDAKTADGETTIGDFVVIKHKTLGVKTAQEWKQAGVEAGKAEGFVCRFIPYADTMYIHMPYPDDFNRNDIEYIILKAGFAPVNGSGWGASDGTAVNEKALKSDVVLYLNQNKKHFEPGLKGLGTQEGIVDNALTLKTAPNKKNYVFNDKFDPTGMVINALCFDGSTKEITVTEDMVSYDFSNEGSGDVEISYGGGSMTYSCILTGEGVPEIALKEGVVLTAKRYGRIDLSNAFLTVTSKEGTKEIAITQDMLGKIDTSSAGTFQTTITYQGARIEAEYTVLDEMVNSDLQGFKYGVKYNENGDSSVIAGWGKVLTLDIQNVRDCSLINIDKIPSLIPGKSLGELVLFNGKTFNELKSQNGNYMMHIYGGNRLIFGNMNELFKEGLTKITILPGFIIPYRESGSFYCPDHTLDWNDTSKISEYISDYNKVLTSEISVMIFDNVLCKPASFKGSIEIPEKTNYFVNEQLDLTGGYLILEEDGNSSVTYRIPMSADMISGYDAAQAGEQTLTVAFGGEIAEFTVTVVNERVTGLKMTKQPTNNKVQYGYSGSLDMTGAEFKAMITTSSGEIERVIPFEEVAISYDVYVLGSGKATAEYWGFKVTFDINVVDEHPEQALVMDYQSGLPSYDSSILQGLVINLVLQNVTLPDGITMRAMWGVDAMPNTLSHMEINGIPAMQWKESGDLARINFYTNQLVFHMDPDSKLQHTTSTGNWTDETELFDTVLFKAGFQFYGVTDDVDHWGTAAPDKYAPIPGAVLKEDILLKNIDGLGWKRVLKTDSDGNLASDALTLTLPEKLVYNVGEELDLTGLKLFVKYQDGGEEFVIIGESDVEGFDSSTVGTKTISVYYKDDVVTFDVTVQEPNDKSGCGAVFGSSGMMEAIFLISCAAIVALLYKKKEQNR